MAVTAGDLIDQVNGNADDTADAALATRCVALAPLYVTQYRTLQDPDGEVTVPEAVVDHATLACAEDIWVRTRSEHGVILTSYQSGDDGSGVTVRIGRDPLAPVRPLLAPWYAPMGFA